MRCEGCFCTYNDNVSECPECGYKKGDIPEKPYYLHPGSVLAGRYIVGTVCGSGGFGTTYRVWDTKLDCLLAIKEYYPNQKAVRIPGTLEVRLTSAKKIEEFEEEKRWFLDEARNMAKFSSHPNIINVFDFFEENGTAYIVMEYLEGQSLKDYMKCCEPKLNCEDTVEITLGVINALKTIHKEGIIHRDICPANIFLCVGGAIKLIDFGSARFSDNSDLLRKQTTVTIGYAPCEQYSKKEPQGIWNDIYALGATMYRMLTGDRPDESTNRKRSLEETKRDTILSPMEIIPDVPESLSNIVMKAMAVEYNMRFKDVYQFEKALSGKLAVKNLAKEKKSRRNKKIFASIAAASVVIAGASILYSYFTHKSQENVIPDGKIAFLYVEDGSEWKKDVYSQIIEKFNGTYQNVEIELSGVPLAEFENKVNDSSFSGVFENNITEAEFATDSFSELNTIFNKDEIHNVVLDEISSIPKHIAPVGFNLPVLYVNTTLESYDNASGIVWEDIVSKGLVVDNDIRLEKYVSGENLFSDEALNLFTSGKAPYYLSTTCNYSKVESALSSQFKVIGISEELDFDEFAFCLSSKNSSSDSEIISKAFVEYFIGESAQDIMHIQNESGYFPINQKTRDIFDSMCPDLEGVADKAMD